MQGDVIIYSSCLEGRRHKLKKVLKKSEKSVDKLRSMW